MPAQDRRLEPEPIVRRQDDVATDFEVLGRPIEISFLTDDGPRAIPFVDLQVDLPEPGPPLTLEDEGLIGFELPPHPP